MLINSILFLLGLGLILVIPLSCVVRFIGALFSRRLRGYVLAHPLLHGAWVMLSLSLIIILISPNLVMRHFPTYYHSARSNDYWRDILDCRGREIVRRHGIIFFYVISHHEPFFHCISETEAMRTRNDALRDLVDQILSDAKTSKNESLVRARLLTGQHADSLDSFIAWWSQNRELFKFDTGAESRHQQHLWTERLA